MATITTYYKGNMLFESKVGNHTLSIDVPEDVGGRDRGPTPLELFVASLGSCIGVYVASYCEKNGIDDTGMTVEINFEKVSNPTRLANLKAIIRLPKGDCGHRVKAIEQTAMHCAVHNTIRTMKELAIEVLGQGECGIKR